MTMTSLLSPTNFKDSSGSPGFGGDFILSPLGLSLSSPFGAPRGHDDFALKDGALCLDAFLAELGEGGDGPYDGGLPLLGPLETTRLDSPFPDLGLKQTPLYKQKSKSRSTFGGNADPSPFGSSSPGPLPLPSLLPPPPDMLSSPLPGPTRRPVPPDHYTKLRQMEVRVRGLREEVEAMEVATAEAERKVATAEAERADLWATLATLRMCVVAGAEARRRAALERAKQQQLAAASRHQREPLGRRRVGDGSDGVPALPHPQMHSLQPHRRGSLPDYATQAYASPQRDDTPPYAPPQQGDAVPGADPWAPYGPPAGLHADQCHARGPPAAYPASPALAEAGSKRPCPRPSPLRVPEPSALPALQRVGAGARKAGLLDAFQRTPTAGSAAGLPVPAMLLHGGSLDASAAALLGGLFSPTLSGGSMAPPAANAAPATLANPGGQVPRTLTGAQGARRVALEMFESPVKPAVEAGKPSDQPPPALFVPAPLPSTPAGHRKLFAEELAGHLAELPAKRHKATHGPPSPSATDDHFLAGIDSYLLGDFLKF